MNMNAYKSAVRCLEMYGNVISVCGKSRRSAENVASMLRGYWYEAVVVKTESGFGRRYAVRASVK